MATAPSIKVSVNGRKYQISGITRQTSCKDLLCALAKTTSCDRELDLFEKWRDCERQLPPSSEPLGLLDWWGQEGTKVKFVARERGVAIKEIESGPLDKKKRPKQRHSSKSRNERHHQHRRRRSDKMNSGDDSDCDDHRRTQRSDRMRSKDDSDCDNHGRHRRSERMRSKDDSDCDVYRRHRRSERTRSKDDSDCDDYKHSRRSYRRNCHSSKWKHYDDSDVEPYTDLLRVVINQTKELKSQVREVRKYKPDKKLTEQSKRTGSEKTRKTVDDENDDDSGVPSINDASSQESLPRGDDEGGPTESEEIRRRMDSGLSSESTTPDIADRSGRDNCRVISTAESQTEIRLTNVDIAMVTNRRETDCRDDERQRLWQSYEDLCLQLCETLEEIDMHETLMDSLASELVTLDEAQSVLTANCQLEDEEELVRLAREAEVTQSLIESVQSLTEYRAKEITVNATQLNEYDEELRTGRMVHESLHGELNREMSGAASRRLLRRKPKRGKGDNATSLV